MDSSNAFANAAPSAPAAGTAAPLRRLRVHAQRVPQPDGIGAREAAAAPWHTDLLGGNGPRRPRGRGRAARARAPRRQRGRPAPQAAFPAAARGLACYHGVRGFLPQPAVRAPRGLGPGRPNGRLAPLLLGVRGCHRAAPAPAAQEDRTRLGRGAARVATEVPDG